MPEWMKVFLIKHVTIPISDETMAPLDPTSKSQVMSRLKQFCSNSIVLVREPIFNPYVLDRFVTENITAYS